MRDPEKKKANDARYREKNRVAINAKGTLARRKYKRKVFEFYGSECAYCKFTDIRALQIDHIDNNGAEERKALGGQNFSGWKFYKHLIDNQYPAGYQTLCANCNMIKQLGDNF
jgi:hypothetical protein